MLDPKLSDRVIRYVGQKVPEEAVTHDCHTTSADARLFYKKLVLSLLAFYASLNV